jgi:hypothetical protein
MTMMQILFWQVRLEECQKLLRGAPALFRRRSGASNASSARTCQCRLGRFVLGEVCGEVRGQRWGSWIGDRMEYFYGADVGICGLNTKKKVVVRV